MAEKSNSHLTRQMDSLLTLIAFYFLHGQPTPLNPYQPLSNHRQLHPNLNLQSSSATTGSNTAARNVVGYSHVDGT
ncbi:uncharacterized protein K460DRAFT_367671 [Cucurbitaria berberidis CBS 394.84]|uniref:Uncharacterized protein n=1 Tax=Cucurbitaria berberidis CBS 394.84 TaxID=1168544 RepID=A0A9P4GCA0_9PLEO|nr:uncharacterized protein K460DRAFT_367671 [Cucurbitaria berberidis CBS 394.84]KAF1842711.1 hypothetical protein K460DRAFT_367671 [Cucurbitaria berberidis CBS 394.84]